MEKAEEVEVARLLTYNTIAKAGWSVERDKSDGKGEAGRIKKYLGFMINSESMMISATDDKLRKVREKMDQVC